MFAVIHMYLKKCNHHAKIVNILSGSVNMSDIKKDSTTANQLDSRHNFALVGLLMALFSFCLSVTTPWVIDEFSPPSKIENVAIDKSVSIANSVLVYLLGGASENEENVSEDSYVDDIVENKPEKHWTDYLSLIVIVIALGGIINGVLGFMRESTRVMGGIAIFFGISAIVAQYMIIMFAMLIFIILIVGILNSFGVSF